MGEGQATGFFRVRHLPPSAPTPTPHTPSPLHHLHPSPVVLFVFLLLFPSVI